MHLQRAQRPCCNWAAATGSQYSLAVARQPARPLPHPVRYRDVRAADEGSSQPTTSNADSSTAPAADNDSQLTAPVSLSAAQQRAAGPSPALHQPQNGQSPHFDHGQHALPRSPQQVQQEQRLLDGEIAGIALPLLVALAADPLAGLVDTAFVGRLGAVELAGMAVGLSIFNTITKLVNFPLVSSTTTSVASAVGAANRAAAAASSDLQLQGEQQSAPSAVAAAAALINATQPLSSPAVVEAASSAVMMAATIGLTEAAVVLGAASAAAQVWGLAAGQPAHAVAVSFLQIRALGAPFTVMMLALQGVFRGISDTKTPLVASLASNVLNIILAPILISTYGVPGAAAAICISQALPTCWLLWRLTGQVRLKLTGLGRLLQQGGPSGFLVLRTVSNTCTYALATSVVARAGASYAAAHQVCFQLWMASTLLADALAVAAQTLLAQKAAAGDLAGARRAADRCLLLGLGLSSCVALALSLFRNPVCRLFTANESVLALMSSVMPLLILTQPINALAFVADGLLFGAGQYQYAAVAMAGCALPAVACILAGSAQAPGTCLVAVWVGLALLMLGRAGSVLVPWVLKDEQSQLSAPFASYRLPGAAGRLPWLDRVTRLMSSRVGGR